jgi:hypothetical protein
MAEKADDASPPDDDEIDRALAQVKKALVALRFGEIVLTVQDGVIIQLERTERIRLPRARRRV